MKLHLAIWILTTSTLFAYLYTIGVKDPGAYISVMTFTYFAILATAIHTAPHYKKPATAAGAVMLAAFAYFAALKIAPIIAR